MASRAVYRIVWVPSAIALAGAVGAFALQPRPVPKVGELLTFTSSDKTLTVIHPANWQSMSMSVGGNSAEVSYRPTKNVMIRFGTDLAGSLMADISRSPVSMPDTSGMPGEIGRQLENLPKQKTPLEKVHEMDMESLAKEFQGYQEGKTEHTTLAGHEALVTDFTCNMTDLFRSRPVSGKRYTALSTERRITVLYYMPQEYEQTLGPTFAKMIRSMAVNPQGG